MTEVYCVCYANCRWRSLTAFEKVMREEVIRRTVQKSFYRRTILGVAFPIIFVLGVTGMTAKFIFSN